MVIESGKEGGVIIIEKCGTFLLDKGFNDDKYRLLRQGPLEGLLPKEDLICSGNVWQPPGIDDITVEHNGSATRCTFLDTLDSARRQGFHAAMRRAVHPSLLAFV